MQKLKIKINLIKIRLLPRCSTRVSRGNDVIRSTLCSWCSCLSNSYKEGPASVAAQTGQTGIIQNLEGCQGMPPSVPSGLLENAFWGCGPLKASWSAQPLSSGSLASCSCSAISDSRLTAAWMKAHCCPCACVLLWMQQISDCSW